MDIFSSTPKKDFSEEVKESLDPLMKQIDERFDVAIDSLLVENIKNKKITEPELLLLHNLNIDVKKSKAIYSCSLGIEIDDADNIITRSYREKESKLSGLNPNDIFASIAAMDFKNVLYSDNEVAEFIQTHLSDLFEVTNIFSYHRDEAKYRIFRWYIISE